MGGMKEHTISVRLSEKTYFRLQNLADEYGLSMSSVLAYLVNERFLSLGLASMVSEKVEPVQDENPGKSEPNFKVFEQPAVPEPKPSAVPEPEPSTKGSRKRHKPKR